MSTLHLSLSTSDLPAATAFYTALFGSAPDKVASSYVRFAPSEHPVVLSLVPGPPTQLAPHEHFGLRFADVADTKAAWERASQEGLNVEIKGDVSCCFARQTKAWATDPDGRPWELYTVTEDLPVHGDSACCA